MMHDVNAKKVNCIIVKDLSRFGRDYIEAGRLIQKTFPAFRVRFIAVIDNFDSLTADHNETNLVLPVKNFVNDSYCRDISQKVRSCQNMKREKGDFIGAFAVYGYKKDEKHKHKLIPDAYAAEVVKKIFIWRIDGMSMSAIANRLNNSGVLSPMEYKSLHGAKFSTSFTTGAKALWSAVAVKRILLNELYTGTMVQGKKETVSYKVKQSVLKPKEEWIRVEDTHEAIVSKEDFESVAKLCLVECRTSKGNETAHKFAGLLFCGDCMEPMIRRVNRYKGRSRVYFICPTRNKGLGCTRHSILEEDLSRVVLEGIKLHLSLFIDKSRIMTRMEQMEVGFEEVLRFDLEIERLHKEQEKYLLLGTGLYEDLKNGILTEEDFCTFRRIYEEQYEKTQETIEKQEQTVKTLFQSGIAAGVKLEMFKEAMELTELNRDVLMSFVNHILICEDKRICLEMKNMEQFSKERGRVSWIELPEQQKNL